MAASEPIQVRFEFTHGTRNSFVEAVVYAGPQNVVIGQYQVNLPQGPYAQSSIDALAVSCGGAIEDYVRMNLPVPVPSVE